MKTSVLENRAGALIKSTAASITNLISKDIVGKNISFKNYMAKSLQDATITGKCLGVDYVHINGNSPRNLIVYIFVETNMSFPNLYQTTLSSIEIL